MEEISDVIVIGGGPAGLMACVGALRQGASVLLVEKGDKLGRKLIISGGGRCNVTNNKEISEIIAQIPGNGRFMYNAFHRFGPREIIDFFQGLGVALKEEDHGRMFPVTDRASTVAQTLIGYLQAQGVRIYLDCPVQGLAIEQGEIKGVRVGDRILLARAVVVAVGGKSVPKTGSTGDGYAWALNAGHTLTRLFPTEVPLRLEEPWIHSRSLMGLSLREVALTLLDAQGKRLTTQVGDMIFTHFGISGPAALRSGHYVSTALARSPDSPLTMRLDLLPERSEQVLLQDLRDLARDQPKRTLKHFFKGLLPERLVALLLEQAQIMPETSFANLSKASCQRLVALCKGFPAQVSGTLSIEEAFVTGGGVHLAEIDPKTMASRKVRGLYFAGEILDVHAHTGGYNITVAFSSGHAAGTAAAKARYARV